LIAQADGPLPLGQVAHIFSQVCQALHFAHEEGFVHRDVKPGNIMIRPDGRVLVADFGIAKASDAATMTVVVPGTPAYMSPEQCRSEVVDRRSDIYSLGVVLYELATGRKPFLGQTESATGGTREKMRWEQMHAVPPSPREHNPNLPAALERVISKAMAKQPEERFSTAMAMLETFEIAGGDELTTEAPPVSVEPLPPGPGVVSPPPVEPVSETPGTTTWQRWIQTAQAQPMMAAIVLVVALAVLGGGGWLVFGRQPPPLPTPNGDAVASASDVEETNTPETDTPTPQIIARISAKVLRDLDIHEGPREEYKVFAELRKDTKVEVTGRNQKGTWWQIIHPEGPDGRGWIDADDAELDTPQPVPEVTPPPPPTDTPTATSTPTPTKTPTPTDTPTPRPTRTPTPTPTPVLHASVNGQAGGRHPANRDIEFCFWSSRTTDAEATVYYANKPVTAREFPNLGPGKKCLTETVSRVGSYELEIVAYDRSGKTVTSESFDFEVYVPAPARFEVFVTINGQCGGSVAFGAQVEICFSANRRAQAEARVCNFGTAQCYGQGTWSNLQKECVQGPMSLLPGEWTWTIDGRDSNGTVASKSCTVSVY
ncbi:MAG: protein kinase, partial [Anaerolineales bacterium]